MVCSVARLAPLPCIDEAPGAASKQLGTSLELEPPDGEEADVMETMSGDQQQPCT